MRLSILCLIFSLFCFPNVHAQVKTFKGNLKDTLGLAVTTGSIIIKYRTEQKIQSDYQLLDDKGNFSFSYNKTWSNLSVEINALGYISQVINLSYEQPLQFTVTLKPATTVLNEVSIRSGRKVVQKGDTTSFDLNAFSNNNETTVEDIIRKLPGMSVDNNGNIRYNSRPIDKVMLEGEDLFDDNYKMLTKNLSASLINKIEVIDKVNTNSVLAGITPGELQVLNLKLKNRNKIVTEGNINLGGGLPGKRYDNRLNILGISPRIKAILLGSMNNIGEDPFSIIGQDNPQYQRSSNSGNQLSPANLPELTSVKEYYYPDIDLQRNNFNQAKAASLNTSIKLDKTWQVKTSAYIVEDENIQTLLNDVHTITNNGTINYTTKNNLNKKLLYQNYNLESTYKPGKNTQWLYQAKYVSNDADYNAMISIEGININQTLKNARQSTEQRLQLTQRLTNSLALDWELFYYYNNNPQRLHLSKALFLDAFAGISDRSANGVIQNSNLLVNQYSGIVRLLGKRNSDIFHINLGYNSSSTEHTAFIYGIDTLQNLNTFNTSDFNKIYDIHNRKGYIDFLYSYAITSKFSIAQNTTAAYEYLKIDTANVSKAILTSTYSNIQSRTTFNYKVGTKGGIALQYRFANRIPQLTDLLPSYWIADYRTLQSGTSAFKKISDHNFTVSYTYADYANAMLLYNGAISYGTNASYYLNKLDIQTLYEISRQVPYYKINNGLLFASSKTEKYWDKLSGNLFIDANLIHTQTSDLTANVLTTSLINNTTIELGYKSAWDGLLNLSFSSKIKLNSLNIHSEKQQTKYTNRYFENRLKLFLKFSDKFNLEIDGEHYVFPNNQGHYSSLFFVDASARYVLKKDKLILDFCARNILDHKSLSFQSIAPLSYSSQQYSLVPGYFMTKVYYRF
jgi:hypothetical protein